MAEDNGAVAEDSPSGGKGKLVQILVIVALMIGEGLAVYFVASAMSVPDPTLASTTELEDDEDGDEELAEIELAQCRPTHRKSGKQIVLVVKVIAVVLEENAEEAQSLAEKRQSRILDRVQFVVRSAEIQHMEEPGLQTIKRRLKNEMDKIFGDPEMLREILLPEFQASGL
ncbi:MAG: hypothetical protein ACPGXK_00875 [Phycisphaerae bacterium]